MLSTIHAAAIALQHCYNVRYCLLEQGLVEEYVLIALN